MSTAYGTKVAEAFAKKLLKEMYDKSLTDVIVNRDYEGEVNAVGSKVNILNIERISEKTYTGANLTADTLYEKNAVLTIDQYKSFYWAEKTLNKWLSYIKNPHSTVVTQKADERNKNMDTFVFGKYGDVAAGNRVGVDYTTGTVAVTATTGVVEGSGVVWTSDMVGRGFKATGHTQWYRIKEVTDSDTIVIEDDLDDVASQYTGGTIDAGATYTIEAADVATVTTSNLLDIVSAMKLRLDQAEKLSKSAVPDSDRWLIVPPEFETILPKATGVALHVPAVYEELVKKGMITMLQGFKVFKSNRLSGDNTNGYRMLAGHSNWMTFAENLLEVGMEDLIGNFGKAYKDLFVYGGKVADTRRHFATEAFVKFTVPTLS